MVNLPLPVDENFLISWEMVVGLLYGIGVLIFLTQLLVEFYSLRKIIKSKSKIKVDGFELIEVEEAISPFSFFKKIVYNRNLFQPEELHNIIEHEKIHAKQLHSLVLQKSNCSESGIYCRPQCIGKSQRQKIVFTYLIKNNYRRKACSHYQSFLSIINQKTNRYVTHKSIKKIPFLEILYCTSSPCFLYADLSSGGCGAGERSRKSHSSKRCY
jgi:hypothetical protein